MVAADPFRIAASYLPLHEIVAVTSFAVDNGLEALHYNPLANAWQFSDGEIYTTSAIILHQTRP
jgi:hypothetical protein